METVEHRADKTLDHAVISTKQIATVDKNAFPFLSLPVELQAEVVNYFSRYFDLKTLRLVSLHVSDIVTPRLYHKVDLRNEMFCNRPLVQRIKSLLIRPVNLRFVRILKTPMLGSEETQLMDRLLPLLRQDSLTEFRFWTVSADHFPTALQMRFMLTNQKNIQYAKIYSHMVPVLDEVLREHESSQVAMLKSVTELDITDSAYQWVENIQSMICWPLKNLDLRILRRMRIDGLFVDDHFLSTLNTLFARGSFVNLSILFFEYINLKEKLTLTNLPSLKTLVLHVGGPHGTSLPLILADDIRLSSFEGWTYKEIEKLTVFLTQTRDLEYLSIENCKTITATGRTQKDLASAIMRHQETLRLLNHKEDLALETELDAWMWDFHIVKAIKSCKKLVNLSFPLGSDMPTDYYLSLIKSLQAKESTKRQKWTKQGWENYSDASVRPNSLIQGPRFNADLSRFETLRIEFEFPCFQDLALIKIPTSTTVSDKGPMDKILDTLELYEIVTIRALSVQFCRGYAGLPSGDSEALRFGPVESINRDLLPICFM
ncbi:hypothetical protein MMC31_004783 [Peltigera leucophlebia]|nr:hypothetical protein [Peltigera leucophlebia]